MTLFEFSKSIRMPVFIEVRPCGETIVSFGLECSLRGRKQINSVHGRGPNLSLAITNFISTLKAGSAIEFPRNFDREYMFPIPQELTYSEGDEKW